MSVTPRRSQRWPASAYDNIDVFFVPPFKSIWASERLVAIIVIHLRSANLIEKHQLWKKNKLQCRRATTPVQPNRSNKRRNKTSQRFMSPQQCARACVCISIESARSLFSTDIWRVVRRPAANETRISERCSSSVDPSIFRELIYYPGKLLYRCRRRRRAYQIINILRAGMNFFAGRILFSSRSRAGKRERERKKFSRSPVQTCMY